MPSWAKSAWSYCFTELKYLWPAVVNVVGVGAIGLAGGAAGDDGNVRLVLFDVDKSWLAWVGVTALLVGTLALLRQSRRTERLEKELSAAEAKRAAAEQAVSALSKAELALLSEQLKFFSSERISLFIKVKGAFLLVARFSRNPAFNTQTGRIYPQGEGCVGSAWEVGVVQENALPDPKLDPDAWVSEQRERWRIPPVRSRAMTMKSRTYLAFRIDRSRGRDPLGVVIFESVDVPGNSRATLNRPSIESAIKKVEGQRIRALLEQMAELV